MTDSPTVPIASGCSQIAYVVKDIQASQKFFNKHLGVPRFYLFDNIQFEDFTYQGQPQNSRIHLALAYAGDIQLELIEHLEGKSIFQDFLQQKGEGIHHLGFLVDDYDQALDDLTARGYPLIQSGRAGSNRWNPLCFVRHRDYYWLHYRNSCLRRRHEEFVGSDKTRRFLAHSSLD